MFLAIFPIGGGGGGVNNNTVCGSKNLRFQFCRFKTDFLVYEENPNFFVFSVFFLSFDFSISPALKGGEGSLSRRPPPVPLRHGCEDDTQRLRTCMMDTTISVESTQSKMPG